MIKGRIRDADEHWDVDGTLSQMAVRAVRPTRGISSVLVGMRQQGYVDDILQELKRRVAVESRNAAWSRLAQSLDNE